MRNAKEILSAVSTPARGRGVEGPRAAAVAERERDRERKQQQRAGKELFSRSLSLSEDVLGSIFSAGDDLAQFTSKSAREVEVR